MIHDGVKDVRNNGRKELDHVEAWQSAADVHPAVKYEKNVILPVIHSAGQLS
jgi:hypothetical protein